MVELSLKNTRGAKSVQLPPLAVEQSTMLELAREIDKKESPEPFRKQLSIGPTIGKVEAASLLPLLKENHQNFPRP